MRLIGEVLKTVGFARKNEVGREARFRLDTMRGATVRGTRGSRQRRIGIVALARKRLIALWRYVDQAIVREGARLKVTLA
jgi:hypothetical protein